MLQDERVTFLHSFYPFTFVYLRRTNLFLVSRKNLFLVFPPFYINMIWNNYKIKNTKISVKIKFGYELRMIWAFIQKIVQLISFKKMKLSRLIFEIRLLRPDHDSCLSETYQWILQLKCERKSKQTFTNGSCNKFGKDMFLVIY